MAHTAASFGYLLPTREVVMSQATPDLSQVIALAEQAEALGFDSVWAAPSPGGIGQRGGQRGSAFSGSSHPRLGDCH
jgi:alkanesulfonate monooxygenase SsuD/methylene tetrahydromethanopterin reductase-like flavin-dependent oxidoreductase (luciferase family)